MKASENWIVATVLAILAIIISHLTGINIWILLLCSFPILFLAMLVMGILNVFSSPPITDLDKNQDKKILEEMDRESQVVTALGFLKIDQFQVKTTILTLIYAFKHKDFPIYMCVYDFKYFKALDIITFFNGDYGFTTSSRFEGGKFPLNIKAFLQVYPKSTYDEMLKAHVEGMEFLESMGLESVEIQEDKTFRQVFKEITHEIYTRIKSHKFWFLKTIYWTFFNDSKKYARPIRQQFEEDGLKIERGAL